MRSHSQNAAYHFAEITLTHGRKHHAYSCDHRVEFPQNSLCEGRIPVLFLCTMSVFIAILNIRPAFVEVYRRTRILLLGFLSCSSLRCSWCTAKDRDLSLSPFHYFLCLSFKRSATEALPYFLIKAEKGKIFQSCNNCMNRHCTQRICFE